MVSWRNAIATVSGTVASAAVCAVAVAMSDQVVAATDYITPAIPIQSAEQGVLRREIVFLDTQVPEYERLAEGIKPGREVVLLDADRDGIKQITAMLARLGDIDAVHIVSHGQAGRLQLGSAWLSMDNLDDYAIALQGWFPERRELAERRPDVVIYACDVAEDSFGKAFVERISALTSADVAASNDRTAGTGLGGDWVMEVATGNIEAGLAFTPQALVDYPFALDVFTVTNLNDAGPGSLRQAITEANANPGADEIVFAGEGANGTLELATDLPDITDDLSINGPGAEVLAISGGDINFVFDFPTYDDDLDAYDFGSGVVSDVTITGGSIGAELAEVDVVNAVLSGSKGSAIRDSAEAAFTLENTIVTGSCSDPEPGPFTCAAIRMTGYNYLGELTLKNSVVSGSGGTGVSTSSFAGIQNSTISQNAGFGVAVEDGEVCSLTIENSTISGNKQDGIHDDTFCDELLRIKILNSTISGNGGNGLLGSDRFYLGIPGLDVEIESSTIAGNEGNGILIGNDAEVILQNTIVAENAPQPEDCGNHVESLGYNLIGDRQVCVVPQATDLTGDPGLGDFVDPGIPGSGHLPLLAASQAIDAGNNEACPETDQLGSSRTDGDNDGTVTCDIGAVEFRVEPFNVNIDIKPRNKRNVVKPRARGGIYVAVLSDSKFDPLQIEIPTVRFGPDGAQAIRHKVKDINRDGLGDLLLRFNIRATGIACGNTEATLTGSTFSGQSFSGSDAIKTIRCKFETRC